MNAGTLESRPARICAREIKERGYTGSESLLRRFLSEWRAELPPILRQGPPRKLRLAPLCAKKRRLSSRGASFLMILPSSKLSQVYEPHVEQMKRNKKYVGVDTYRIHFAKPVQAFLAEHLDEVELVRLPTSSPKLNPVERECSHLRRRVTHNHLFHSLDGLMEAVQAFFCDMATSPDVIRQVAGLAA